MTDVSDEELMILVMEADEEGFLAGDGPPQRSLSIISTVMEKLGHGSFVLAGLGTLPIVRRISDMHRRLYRPADLAVGGIHGGIFMFRDVFARISIPHIYGKVSIAPFELLDLAPVQLGWLRSRSRDANAFLDQFGDVFDFAGGIGGLAQFKRPPDEALEIFELAAFQLQAAAAALSVAFDFRGAVQSSLIGTELALKGGLAAIGKTEGERRAHGHNLLSAAEAFASEAPGFDISRIRRALAEMPPYVKNRYSPTQPGRIESGRIAMRAQYVAGEVMRQITGYSFSNAENPTRRRTYP